MANEILIEADLGLKGVEKTDIFVYEDGRLVETQYDQSYCDLKRIAGEFRTSRPGTKIEVWCSGEDACCGRLHRWKVDI
ncbi:MAG: hypothetical protein SV775_06450 [Thermodesulfobacteriota bacterium]|nr:hypothetical protein [Thermodesulfobacteriota bacterium]